MTQSFKDLVDNCGMSLRGASELLDENYERIRNMYYDRTKTPDSAIEKMKEFEQAAKEIFDIDERR